MIDRTGSPRTTSSRSPLVRALVSKRAMLVGITGAALLVVQVAQAQAPNGNAITLAVADDTRLAAGKRAAGNP